MDQNALAPAKPTIQGVSYTHDGIIDEILLNPAISQRALSTMFGYTEAWMSIIINSDAFKHRLAERKAELVDPTITATVQDRLDGLATISLDRLLDRVSMQQRPIKDADLIAMAKLGIGDKNNRTAVPTTQNNLYVVALPPQAINSQAWLENRSDRTPIPAIPIAERVDRG